MLNFLNPNKPYCENNSLIPGQSNQTVKTLLIKKTKVTANIEKLNIISGLNIHGNPSNRGGVISFNLNKIHPQDLAQFLNEDNICIRVGHHCAQPLLKTLGETSTARISFYVYNDSYDVDKLVESIQSTINYC